MDIPTTTTPTEYCAACATTAYTESQAAALVRDEQISRELTAIAGSSIGFATAMANPTKRAPVVLGCAFLSAASAVGLFFYLRAHTLHCTYRVAFGPLLLSYQPPSVERSGALCTPRRHYVPAPGRWYLGPH